MYTVIPRDTKASLCKNFILPNDMLRFFASYYEKLPGIQKLRNKTRNFYLQKIHTGRLLAQFDDIFLIHFKNILKSRQKQSFLDRYFSKRPLLNQVKIKVIRKNREGKKNLIKIRNL